MKWFNNLKVSRKVAVAFIIIVSIMVTIGVHVFISIRSVTKNSDMVDSGNQMISMLLEARRQEKNFQLRGFEKYGKDTKNSFEKWEDHVKSMYKLIEAQKSKEIETAIHGLLDDIRKSTGMYEEAFRKYIIFYKKDSKLELELDAKLVDSARNYQNGCMKLIDTLKQEMAGDSRMSFILSSVLILLGLITSLVIGYLLSRSISRPVNLGLDFARKFATGDLTARIPLHQKDEMGLLAEGLNKAAENLGGLVSGVIVASQNLAQAVDQIASGNQNLSQRTSEQASALEEIASTIEEAAATTRQNSDNAHEANILTDESYKLAESGGKISAEAVKGINEINDVSRKISDITTVINEISFQTNLLALNAAVEAARAGAAGRGFAVVAAEIRNLAQRSGGASKEIESLIRDTIDKIGKGSGLVNKSGESLLSIIEGIRKVGAIVSEINSASMEQKLGMEQLNIAITEMDSMTQQNAALVEETASASEEMANQAEELLAMTKFFIVNDREDRSMDAVTSQKKPIVSSKGNGNGNGNGKKISRYKSAGDYEHMIMQKGDSDIKKEGDSKGFEQF